MKKLWLISPALALLLVPLSLSGQMVEPVSGAIHIGAHIEFTGRYSSEDNKHDKSDSILEKIEEPYWSGYETFNLEAAVVYLTGKVGDRITWVFGEALTMQTYDLGAIGSDIEEGIEGRAGNDEVIPARAATLLDARIIWNISEGITLNMGRYIPGTSMSMSPHRLAVHHLVDPPMFIKAGGYGFHLIPLPRYQTGMGMSAEFGPATVSWDFFNGNVLANPDSLSDVDRCTGGVLKAAVDRGGFHAGLYYLNDMGAVEDVSIPIKFIPNIPDVIYGETEPEPVSLEELVNELMPTHEDIILDEDNNLTQWGLELAYTTNRIIAAFEYLDTMLDLKDTGVPDLKQQSYYFLLGGKVGPVDLIFRYEFADAGYDEYLDGLKGRKASENDISDQQVNYTLGVNYEINDNTTIALNYAWRQPEVPGGIKLDENKIPYPGPIDLDGNDKLNKIEIDWNYPDINEISLMVELDML